VRGFVIALALSAVSVPVATYVHAVEVDGRLEQGGLAFGSVDPGTKLTLDGKEVSVSETGRFVFGFDRNAKATAELVAVAPDGAQETQTLTIAPRDWIIERVDGLPQNTVTPNPETVKRIQAEGGMIVAARNRTEPLPFFETGFLQPAEGRISGVFGSQRILNGQPRSPHSGLDIAAPIGTPILATADGVVSLVHNGMILTGKTIMIDHGFGLDSVYIHMDAIHVEEGQRVQQGDLIGEIGMTGRTNGPHLHFGISWYGARLDPQTVMSALPARQQAVQ